MAAFGRIPREAFVPLESRHRAYQALPTPTRRSRRNRHYSRSRSRHLTLRTGKLANRRPSRTLISAELGTLGPKQIATQVGMAPSSRGSEPNYAWPMHDIGG